MKERPILFSGPMVRAILEGRKTQTRRVLRVPNHPAVADWVLDSEYRATARAHNEEVARQFVTTFPYGRVRCRYGQPGDRLWVRETWADLRGMGFDEDVAFAYRADSLSKNGDEDADSARCRNDYGVKWKPSIHMPRAASRITLEVVSMRVERLQAISEADADAEGFGGGYPASAFPKTFSGDCGHMSIPECFRVLWDSINARRGYGWDTNPWVWVVEFKAVKP